ncbi:MAG: cytochrome c [Roseobacter sp.]
MKRLLLNALVGAALLGGAFYALCSFYVDSDSVVLRNDNRDLVARGAGVYLENCASCHGANLEGKPNWRVIGADGRLPAPPRDASGHTWHHDSDTLFRLTKYGTGALIGDPDYASNMPIYEGVLADDEIIAVLGYIKSTWPDDIRARHDEMENR